MQPKYQRFNVPSATTPGAHYTVTVTGGKAIKCTCPDAVYRKRQCKHQRQVLVMWTTAGRSGALVAQAQAAQVSARADATQHGYGAYVRGVALCRCGWQSQPTIDALVALAEHVSAARRGERAAERAYLVDSEADLAAARRITRVI